MSTPPLESLLPPKRERSGEATRKRILDGAELEFAAKGFDGARLAAIARAADVPQALIHHYFDDKEGLYRAVLERAIGAIVSEGWKILDAKAPPKKRAKAARFGRRELEALIEAYVAMLVDFYATHGHALRILRSEAARGGTLANELVRRSSSRSSTTSSRASRRCSEAGEVRADVEPQHLCLSTVAMACFPTMEEAFLGTVWGMSPKDARVRRGAEEGDRPHRDGENRGLRRSEDLLICRRSPPLSAAQLAQRTSRPPARPWPPAPSRFARAPRALVDEARVHLHEVGPGADERHRVLGALDAADADDRSVLPKHAPHAAHEVHGSLAQRRAAQAPRANRLDACRRRRQARARDRRVRRDHAGEPRVPRSADDRLEPRVVQVRRDLHEQRLARRARRERRRAACRAASFACIARSPAVLGEDTLTTRKSATSRTASSAST